MTAIGCGKRGPNETSTPSISASRGARRCARGVFRVSSTWAECVVSGSENDKNSCAVPTRRRQRHPRPSAGGANRSGARARHGDREPPGRGLGDRHRSGVARRARWQHPVDTKFGFCDHAPPAKAELRSADRLRADLLPRRSAVGPGCQRYIAVSDACRSLKRVACQARQPYACGQWPGYGLSPGVRDV